MSNTLKGIKDCSRKQYHNEKFKEEAERVGLEVEKIKQHGYAGTKLNQETKEIVDTWNINQEIFNIHRLIFSKLKPASTKKTKIKMFCPVCNKKVNTIENDIEIICGKCGCKFKKLI